MEEDTKDRTLNEQQGNAEEHNPDVEVGRL